MFTFKNERKKDSGHGREKNRGQLMKMTQIKLQLEAMYKEFSKKNQMIMANDENGKPQIDKTGAYQETYEAEKKRPRER